jgi:carbonic anhydrase/acetyltransferase-like protein (isoleucine patch superfamily)
MMVVSFVNLRGEMSRMLLPYGSRHPQIDSSVFVACNATLIGDVAIAGQSSVWFNVVIRGDVNHIHIGARTNVQDGTVVHVTHDVHPTLIGDDVTIGHNATVHGCTIEGGCLIGIGAVILDGVVIGHSSLVAAGTVLVPGTKIPPGSLVMGAPGRVKRELSVAERAQLLHSAQLYVGYREAYLGQR